MLHLLLQGRVVQSKCAVGSWYQSSTVHYHLLCSRSRHPINPKTSISTVSPQSRGSDLIINKCFMLSYLLVLKYILFCRQKKPNFSPLQFQLLQTRSHLSFYLYPDLFYACPLLRTEMKQS